MRSQGGTHNIPPSLLETLQRVSEAARSALEAVRSLSIPPSLLEAVRGPTIPPSTLEALQRVSEAAFLSTLEETRRELSRELKPSQLRAFQRRVHFLFVVSAALARRARSLNRPVLREAYRLATSLWRAVYRAFLLGLLALLGLLGQEEEAEERPGVKTAREERPPPKPIIALITPKVISPTAGPNAA
jgi:hypothetical protein